MHPDLMREVLSQRAAERREEARKLSLARALRKAMRQRNRAEAPGVPLRPIPDYVDGTFCPSGEGAAARVGAARGLRRAR